MNNTKYPLPHEPDSELYSGFFESMKRGELRARRCASCAAWQWPPRPFCRQCQGTEFTWEAVANSGEIYTFTVMHRAFSEYYADKVPYGVVVVDVGPVRLPGRYVGNPGDIKCGDAVTAKFDEQARAGSSLAWEPSKMT